MGRRPSPRSLESLEHRDIFFARPHAHPLVSAFGSLHRVFPPSGGHSVVIACSDSTCAPKALLKCSSSPRRNPGAQPPIKSSLKGILLSALSSDGLSLPAEQVLSALPWHQPKMAWSLSVPFTLHLPSRHLWSVWAGAASL